MSKKRKPPRCFQREGFLIFDCGCVYLLGVGATMRSSIGLLAAVKPYISV